MARHRSPMEAAVDSANAAANRPPFEKGQRLEIPVHYDAWMRGARFGEVRGFRRGTAGQSDYLLVRMDHPGLRRCLKLWRPDWPYAKEIGQ